jgi:hypothetical protein
MIRIFQKVVPNPQSGSGNNQLTNLTNQPIICFASLTKWRYVALRMCLESNPEQHSSQGMDGRSHQNKFVENFRRC